MKKYFKRIKYIWTESNSFGKLMLVFNPYILLLAGFNNYWDNKKHNENT